MSKLSVRPDIVEHSPAVLGMSLSADGVRSGVIWSPTRVGAFRRVSLKPESRQERRLVIGEILATAGEVIAAQPADSPITAIGIGIPGLVDRSAGRIIRTPAWPALAGIDPQRDIAEVLGVPVFLESSPRAATLAEAELGVGRGVSDLLYLHLGASIGAGLVLGGRLHEGRSGLSGAIGRMSIYVEHLATSMPLEELVTTDNIVRRTQLRLDRDSTSSLSRFAARGGFTWDDIIAEAHHGDELARLMISRTGMFIGIALADVISLLALSMVAIGGAVPARQLLAEAIAAEIANRVEDDGPWSPGCRITAATVGVEAVAIGAGLAAIEGLQG